MRIYQKQLEKYLNKSYKTTPDRLFVEFLRVVPGEMSIVKTAEAVSERNSIIPNTNKDIYKITNKKNQDFIDISEEEWDNEYKIDLEIWITKNIDGTLFVE